MAFARWQPALRCADGPTPGARALMRWILEHHPKASNLGIYACRPVRGGTAMSCHAEGRALDVGFPMVDGRGSPAGYALVRQIVPNARRLGVQAVIYDRRIWSAKTPAGRPYHGINPHRDHVHIELTRHAGAKLTLATVRHVLGKPPAAGERVDRPAGGDRPRGRVVLLKRGDTLAALVEKHSPAGTDWRDVWRDSRNGPLRKKRGRPELIRPGDALWVP